MHLVILGKASAKKLQDLVESKFDDIELLVFDKIETFVQTTSVRTLPVDRLILMQDALPTKDLEISLNSFNEYMSKKYSATRMITVSSQENITSKLASVFVSPFMVSILWTKMKPAVLLDIVEKPIDVITARYGYKLKGVEDESIQETYEPEEIVEEFVEPVKENVEVKKKRGFGLFSKGAKKPKKPKTSRSKKDKTSNEVVGLKSTDDIGSFDDLRKFDSVDLPEYVEEAEVEETPSVSLDNEVEEEGVIKRRSRKERDVVKQPEASVGFPTGILGGGISFGSNANPTGYMGDATALGGVGAGDVEGGSQGSVDGISIGGDGEGASVSTPEGVNINIQVGGTPDFSLVDFTDRVAEPNEYDIVSDGQDSIEDVEETGVSGVDEEEPLIEEPVEEEPIEEEPVEEEPVVEYKEPVRRVRAEIFQAEEFIQPTPVYEEPILAEVESIDITDKLDNLATIKEQMLEKDIAKTTPVKPPKRKDVLEEVLEQEDLVFDFDTAEDGYHKEGVQVVEVERIVEKVVVKNNRRRTDGRSIIVTGDRKTGITKTAINMASHYAKEGSTLYVDFDIARKGSLLYLGIENVAEEEEYVQNSLCYVKSVEALKNNTYKYNGGLFDCLVTMYGVEVEESDLITVQRLLTVQSHYKNVIIDCPVEYLHLLEDLIMYSEVVACVESTLPSAMNTLFALSEISQDEKLTSFIFRNTSLFLAKDNEITLLRRNLLHISNLFSLDEAPLDWSRLPIIGSVQSLPEVVSSL